MTRYVKMLTQNGWRVVALRHNTVLMRESPKWLPEKLYKLWLKIKYAW